MVSAESNSRQHVNRLIQAALSASNPAERIRRTIRIEGGRLIAQSFSFDLSQGRIFLVAVGKAAVSMASSTSEIVGNFLVEGVVIAKRGLAPPEKKQTIDDTFPATIRTFYAGHPISDEAGINATNAVIQMLKRASPDDLVLFLISGGTSALLTQPIISLAEWQELVEILLASGCTINELNAIRKQLDQVKGGGLARIAAPATCLTLILSDVIGNPLDIIGSGPTVPNPDTIQHVRNIMDRLRIQDQLGNLAWQRLNKRFLEIENEGLSEMPIGHHIIIGDVRRAAIAAVETAIELGFKANLLTAFLEGEAREVGRVAGAIAKEMAPGTCYVLGGETTVTLRGNGLGSRNLELALASAIAIDKWERLVVATFATDGDDGPTGAAGAIVSGHTIKKALRLGLDAREHLDRNDSYHFFEPLGDLIITGQTGTNVNDLLFLLCYTSEQI